MMTLGSLRSFLSILPAQTQVVLPDGRPPSRLGSYRGYYERLAFGGDCTHVVTRLVRGEEASSSEYEPGGYYQPGAVEVQIGAPTTAQEVIKALNLAEGVAFEGYKGGQFHMDSGTFLHVAEYGDCGGYLVGLGYENGRVVFLTAIDDLDGF